MTAVPLTEVARMMSSSLANAETVALLNLPTSYPYLSGTADPANNTITVTGTAPPDGTRVMMAAPAVALATAPGGTTDGAIYYVKKDSATELRLAATLKDVQDYNFVDLTSSGSGFSLSVQPPGQGSVADAVQYELPSGNGYGRLTGNLGSVTVLASTAETAGYLATFPLASGVTFNAILTMIFGNPSIGDTDGDLTHLEILGSSVTTNGSPYSRFIKVIGSAI